MTLENEQSVDMSVIRRAAKKIKTPRRSASLRLLRNLPEAFTLQDLESSNWGEEIGKLIYADYRRGCRDLSDDSATCEHARREWDEDIMADLEQRHYEFILDATDGIKLEIDGELPGVLRDIRDDARELAETLMWRALRRR